MKDRARRIPRIALLVLLVLFYSTCGEGETGAANQTVETAEIAKPTIETFGIVTVTRERIVTLGFPATIEKAHVLPGQKVSRGTVLLELDLRQYHNQIAEVENKLKIERLRLDQIQSEFDKTGSATSLEDKRLQADINSYEREIEQLTKEHEALAMSIENDGSPELRKLRIDLDFAQRTFKTAEDGLNLARAQFRAGSTTRKELEQEENAVEAIRSQVAGLELSIESLENRQNDDLDRMGLNIAQKRSELENLKSQYNLLAGPEASRSKRYS